MSEFVDQYGNPKKPNKIKIIAFIIVVAVVSAWVLFKLL